MSCWMKLKCIIKWRRFKETRNKKSTHGGTGNEIAKADAAQRDETEVTAVQIVPILPGFE